jgi:hypothetical protein
MGHHLFTNGSSVLPMKDGDVELVRHFLILGARALGLHELAKNVKRWDWQGPGVWINVEEKRLADHPAVFEAAVRAVEKLGDTVDVGYLNTELQHFGMEWQVPQKVSRIVFELNGLKKHILEGGA